jgi:hypothetical protein
MNDDESERIVIGSGRGLILRYYPGIRLGRTEEKHEKLQSG